MLQYARNEQKINAARLAASRAYRTSVLEETLAESSARVDSLQAAAAGRPGRALQLRSAKADVREAIIEDVERFPHEPHKWKKITRDVAFLEGEEFANRVLPVDTKAIDREYEKGRRAIHRASPVLSAGGIQSGTVANKEADEGVFEDDGVSPAQALKSFRMHLNLSMFDEEIEHHLDDELAALTARTNSVVAAGHPPPSDAAESGHWSFAGNQHLDSVDAEVQPQQTVRMAHVKAVSNPSLSTFVEQASGPAYDALVVKARIKKNKAERQRKVVPPAREVRDAETGELTELHNSTYVHYEDRLDEGRSMAVLGVVGKLKNRLSKFRSGGESPTLGTATTTNDFPSPTPPSSNGTSAPSTAARSSPVSSALGAFQRSPSPNAFAGLLKGVGKSSPSQSPGPSVPPSAAAAPPSPVDWEAMAGLHLAVANAPPPPSAPPPSDGSPGGGSRQSAKDRRRRILEYQDRQVAKARSGFPGGNFAGNTSLDDSVLSDFDYLVGSTPGGGGGGDRQYYQQAANYHNQGTTPIVDIGAADSLNDLLGWADSAMKMQVVELSILKDRKNRELLDFIHAEEEEERRRKKVEKANPHPSRLERLRVRHDKERKERRAVIERIRQENELVIANKLAEWGLIR